MNRLATLLSVHARWAWTVVFFAGLAVAVAVGMADADWRARQRLSLLQTEAMRSAIEVMSSTLNGNLMGSITLLGLIDNDIKQDAQNGLLSVDAAIDGTLGAVGAAFDAEGVFVVASDGIVKSSWDRAGKPSTGLDVKFRPYFQMALRGQSNVYAAVSMARGDRALYFTAPIYGERAKSTSGVGALVARTTLERVDKLLQNRFDTALLLSPQGVVFASNRAEWIGRLEGVATPQRLKSIRDLKQFGAMFEKTDPERLPVAARDGLQDMDGTRYAVATADVEWHDPSGQWKLVVLEDLSVSAPLDSSATRGGLAAVAFWLLGWMVMHLYKGRHAQLQASAQLQLLAGEQERLLKFRTQLGAAMVRLQQSPDIAGLCRTFLTDAHALFGALQGVVYTRAKEGSAGFVLQGSFACDGALPSSLQEGEGVLGQCAIERTTRVLDASGEHCWTIRSGLGSTQPAALVVAPVIRNEHVLGLVEIALLDAPSDFARDSFEELVQLLALNLQILLRADQTRLLLEQAHAIRQANADQLHLQQTLIDNIPYPVFYKGADGRFLGFNRAYEETFGVARADLIGKSVMDLTYLPLADREAYQAEDMATIASAGVVSKTMPIPFADGKVHNTLYYVAGFRNADGTPGGLVGTFSDLDALPPSAAATAVEEVVEVTA
ncbi:MAG: GAF domain-containing protein [Rhodoferax sp.]|nr:MAG: GAF domain-containing protein [Rhodoferax sp.]